MSDDSKAFRQALGQFATGVTVVTTVGSDGVPTGLTVSSFNSVSLEPPLVLWSLDRLAHSMPVFQVAPYFAVHVLSQDQMNLSNTFAQAGGDKFAGLTWNPGIGGVPLLPECCAVFQCETAHRYDGGDHVIFVGEVQAFDSAEDRAPLVFCGGRYTRLAQD